MRQVSLSIKLFWLLLFFTQSSVFAANLPVLGVGKSLERSGQFVETAANFQGGASENHTDYRNYLQPKLSNGLTVQGRITVAPEDVGKQADLLVVIGREAGLPYDGGVDTLYYSISSYGQTEIVDLYASPDVWMSKLEKAPYRPSVTLANESKVEFQLDNISAPTMYYVFIGYRLQQNGRIVYSANPMMLEMTMTTASLSPPFSVTLKSTESTDPPPTPPSISFVNQEKAIVGQSVTSNSLISSKTETVSVIGDAQLVINGNVAGQTATVNPNDAIALTTIASNGRKEVSVRMADKSITWTVQGVAIAPELPVLPGKISGYTPVNCEVSESGGATCQLPLSAPAGTGGMAPKLSLGYNSQGNNGPVGVGWSLNGLSAITRCRATQAQDGLIDAVDFDAHDRFCLDGERLMAVEGEYGAEGTIYYTEQHTFQKIVSFLNPETKMPRFKAWTKTGLILEYGFTTDSSVEAQGRKEILIWAVNKIQDTKGNYLSVSYDENNDNGEYYPERIDYTSNDVASLAPYATVDFVYEDRPDILPAFIGGTVSKVTKRLSLINIWDHSEAYRSYSLNYNQVGVTQQSRLSSVQECGSDAECFEPTVFGWSNDSETRQYEEVDTIAISNTQNIRTGDFNGDGKTDLYVIGEAIYLMQDKGKYLKINAPSLANSELRRIRFGDFNGDGKTDIYFIHGYNGSATGDIFLSIGDGNYTRIDGINSYIGKDGGSDVDIARLKFGDFNGDSKTDIYIVEGWGTGHILPATIHLSNGDGTYKVFQGPATFVNNNIEGALVDIARVQLGDFDGDGKADIYSINGWGKVDTGTIYFLSEDGNHTTANGIESYVDGSIKGSLVDIDRLRFVDFNGDGKTDIYVVNGWKDTQTGTLYLSQGKGTFTTISGIPTYVGNDHASAHTQIANVRFGEFNGDEFLDIYHELGIEDKIYLSQGNGQYQESSSSGSVVIPESRLRGFLSNIFKLVTTATTELGDFDGDGKTDVYQPNNGKLYLNSATSQNFLLSVTNGHGVKTEFHYKSLSDSSVYEKENNAEYPQVDVQLPFHVVSDYEIDNGIGGKKRTSYFYQGAKVDVQGRGFRGFSKITQTNEATGIQNIAFQDTDYRYINAKLKRSESRLLDGRLLSETDNTPEFKDYGHGVYSSWVKQSVTKAYELDGSLTSTTTTTTQYDEYNNPTQVQIDYSDGRSQTVKSTYTNDLDRWILGRLTQTQVTNNAAGQGSQTRTSRFEYDPESGLLVKEIIEPDQALCVEKVYTHDAFGNVLSSTTQGCTNTTLPIEPRTQRSEYDTQGRYLLRNINVLGHSETKQYHLGNQIALTGPNGLTTRWEYDGFGRVTKEIRADGTWTQTGYRLCEGETHCPTHAHYFVQTDTAGSPSSVVYFDRLDREIRKVTQGFDGNPIYIDSQYNARGEVVKVSDPYFATATPVWTSNEYDVVGRVIKQIAPDETVTLKEYHGLTTIVMNPLGQRTTQVKDSQGNLLKSEDSQGKSVTYIYDGFNNPLEMRDSLGNVTQMSYDQRGNKTRLDDPDTQVTTYSYNALGELLSQTDAKNQTTTFRYDLLGRLVERQEPEGTTTWEYDIAPKGIGSLAKLASSSGYSEIYRYDSFGRATETLTTFNERTFPVTHYYDQFGRTATIVYPTSFAVRYIYNNYGYLQEVQRTDSNQSVWKAERMNARGQLEKQVAGNGVVTQRTYDTLTGHLQTIQTGTSAKSQSVQNLSYRFDSLGNLIERRKDSLSETFAYDSLNRLEKSSVSGGQTLTMRYDELGNITFKSDVGNYTYGSGAGPHAVTQVGTLSYSYDIVGNRISASNGQQIQYTSFNKPSRITQGSTTLEFSYSPDYDRYQQVSTQYGSTKTILYVGSLYEQETENGLTEHKHTIFAGSDSVAVYTTGDKGEKTHWLHKDHLGSMESITDEQGNRVESLSFDAWGQRRSENWSVLTQAELETLARTVDLHRGFTGHEHLDEVNLIHMNGRVYDPVIGRFLSADPFIQFPEFTQSLNRYSYVLNNPLSFTDPTGFKIDWKQIVATVAGAILGAVTGGIANLLFGNALVAIIFSGAGFGFGAAFTGTLLHGGSFSQALRAGLKSGLIGGVTAGLTFGVGHVFFEGLPSFVGSVTKVIAHGAVQGLATMAQGGKFEHGFLSGIFGKLGARFGFIGSVVAAGTAAELGGGKFMNGAVSGAFVYLFNDAVDERMKQKLLMGKAPERTLNTITTWINGRSRESYIQELANHIPKGSSVIGALTYYESHPPYIPESEVVIQSGFDFFPNKIEVLSNSCNITPNTDPRAFDSIHPQDVDYVVLQNVIIRGTNSSKP